MNPHLNLIGIPFDRYSSHLKGAARAPEAIWEMILNDSANQYTELGVNLENHQSITNLGNINFESSENEFSEIENRINQILADDCKPLSIGGDHSITYPIFKAIHRKHPNVTILHFDAHPDLYDELDGNRLSHACPFARIMEDKLAKHLVQIGIRTLNQHQREQAQKFDVEIHEMKDWTGPEQLKLIDPIYVSIDLDALDPAYAPGVSHHEPGGMSVRQIIDVIHSLDVPIVGADIVEYNPLRDINGMTAMVATKLYKELSGKMLEQ